MKDNQHEQLFTELTPVEASVIEGGKTVIDSDVSFKSGLYTREFSVGKNQNVALTFPDFTESGDGAFSAVLIKRATPDIKRETKTINAKDGELAIWARQPAGTYRIFLSDSGGQRFTSSIKVDVENG